jgi:hypothetical protein
LDILKAKSEDELTQLAMSSQVGSQNRDDVEIEFRRREHLRQMEVAERQIAAAEATIATAEHTRRNANYMLWSVIALFLTSGITALVTWFKPD